LANIDFAQRVSADRSGFSVPPIAMRDPRNLLVRAVRGGDETIFRDLKFTLAALAGWRETVPQSTMALRQVKHVCRVLLMRGFLPDIGIENSGN
jgi:hypothetical protein